jgi:spermidine synthase
VKEHRDVVISDLTDPAQGGSSLKLLTKEYFELCRCVLESGGVFAGFGLGTSARAQCPRARNRHLYLG